MSERREKRYKRESYVATILFRVSFTASSPLEKKKKILKKERKRKEGKSERKKERKKRKERKRKGRKNERTKERKKKEKKERNKERKRRKERKKEQRVRISLREKYSPFFSCCNERRFFDPKVILFLLCLTLSQECKCGRADNNHSEREERKKRE